MRRGGVARIFGIVVVHLQQQQTNLSAQRQPTVEQAAIVGRSHQQLVKLQIEFAGLAHGVGARRAADIVGQRRQLFVAGVANRQT